MPSQWTELPSGHAASWFGLIRSLQFQDSCQGGDHGDWRYVTYAKQTVMKDSGIPSGDPGPWELQPSAKRLQASRPLSKAHKSGHPFLHWAIQIHLGPSSLAALTWEREGGCTDCLLTLFLAAQLGGSLSSASILPQLRVQSTVPKKPWWTLVVLLGALHPKPPWDMGLGVLGSLTDTTD
ncbi:hypothetical protein P7K49_034070 [Saguinus oedipus]|uniref:Uncharacterized protein n=1 Tax=Saguinus oedipus TaxID=9490 RepID=A0ABQ9TUS6_SAGOE|nr:hypothetical protein P7K49_034070 [Saguinus oedipus]